MEATYNLIFIMLCQTYDNGSLFKEWLTMCQVVYQHIRIQKHPFHWYFSTI